MIVGDNYLKNNYYDAKTILIKTLSLYQFLTKICLNQSRFRAYGTSRITKKIIFIRIVIDGHRI